MHSPIIVNPFPTASSLNVSIVQIPLHELLDSRKGPYLRFNADRFICRETAALYRLRLCYSPPTSCATASYIGQVRKIYYLFIVPVRPLCIPPPGQFT